MRMTKAQADALMRRARGQAAPAPAPQAARDGMNKLETAYAQTLELMRRSGQIQWFGYESITFRLAPRTRYTPDFLVVTDLGLQECHEVKGFWRDDARVKFKVAAEMYPMFRFLSVHKNKNSRLPWQWVLEDIRDGCKMPVTL